MLKRGVTIVDRTMVAELLTDERPGRRAAWASRWTPTELVVFRANAVVLAAGAGGFRPDALAHQQSDLRRGLHGVPGGRGDHRQGVRRTRTRAGRIRPYPRSLAVSAGVPRGAGPPRGDTVDAEGNRCRRRGASI